MIDNAKLKEAISRYKSYFTAQWDDERYKWEAVKCFQDNWDISATDFSKMWLAATAKTSNLLVSVRNFPRSMVEEFAKADPEGTRAMFTYLFDEGIDLNARIKHFITASDTLKEKYGKNADGSVKWANHYQNLNSISTYLWLRFPDKYYIYKVTEMRKAASLLGCDFVPKNGQDPALLLQGYEFLDEVRKGLKEDLEMKEILNSMQTPDCYGDPEFVTMTVDFDFYMSRFYASDMPNKVRYWTYSPGEKGSMWDKFHQEGIMALGWDDLGDITQYASTKELVDKMNEVYGTKTNHMNDKRSTWDFANKLKVGDVIFVKGGQKKLLGRGIVESDYIYDPGAKSFRSVRKVNWTDKGDWTIKSKFAQKALTDITYATDFIKELNDTIGGVAMIDFQPSGYWWLTASPDLWDINDIEVGEEQNYTKKNESGNRRQIIRNFDAAKAGDKIVAYEANPVKAVLALGELSKVDTDNIYFTKTEALTNTVSLDEIKSDPVLVGMEFLKSPNGSLFYLSKTEYDRIVEIIREKNPIAPADSEEECEPYTKDDFLGEVFMSEESCDELIEIVRRKKNVIFEGAPGVGKTFAAKRLAYLMMGKKDKSRIMSIQFHQNYSYENFIEGYKPDEKSFHIESGVFTNFCNKAKDDPGNEYFFIIDEINRGNMSKIFGELLALIESDYRGSEHALPLSYSKHPFFVPENVYIIGMMNTADRSLAIIDYALRRRFAFYEMSPGFSSAGFNKMQTAIANPKYDNLISAIEILNKTISEDPSLGDGFRIGHSYFCASPEKVDDKWLATVVKFEIIPLIKEYWFDNSATIKEESNKILDSIK